MTFTSTLTVTGSPSPAAVEEPPIIGPDNGTLQAVSFSTGTTYWSTPDSNALDITGPIDLRFKTRSIGDPTGGGTGFFSRIVDKWFSAADHTSCYGAGISLVDAGDRVDALYFAWTDDAILLPDLPGGVTDGPDVFAEYRVIGETGLTGDPAGQGWTYTNRTTTYIRDDTDPDDVTADGKGWALLVNTDPRHATHNGTTCAEGNGNHPRVGTGPLVFLPGQGIGTYLEVRNGIDGTLVADFNPARDATHGATSVVSTTTGETWTGTGGARVFDGTHHAWVGSKFASWSVADNALLDFDATTDFTVAALVRPATGTGVFSTYVSKVSGTPGVNGVGYALAQSSGAGGEIGLVCDADPSLVFSASAGSASRKLVAMTVDRTANTVTHYLNGTAATAASASSVGSVANSAALLVGADLGTDCPALIEAVAVWRRKLTAAEHLTLLTELGA